jgi:hypothetical protein
MLAYLAGHNGAVHGIRQIAAGALTQQTGLHQRLRAPLALSPHGDLLAIWQRVHLNGSRPPYTILSTITLIVQHGISAVDNETSKATKRMWGIKDTCSTVELFRCILAPSHVRL